MNAKLRTDQSFRGRYQPEHHNGRSSLEDLNVDMVDNVPNDGMHLCDLGVMKKLLLSWVKKRRFERVMLSKEMITRLSNLMVFVSNFMPSIFARKLRDIEHLPRFKATEFRQIRLVL